MKESLILDPEKRLDVVFGTTKMIHYRTNEVYIIEGVLLEVDPEEIAYFYEDPDNYINNETNPTIFMTNKTNGTMVMKYLDWVNENLRFLN